MPSLPFQILHLSVYLYFLFIPRSAACKRGERMRHSVGFRPFVSLRVGAGLDFSYAFTPEPGIALPMLYSINSLPCPLAVTLIAPSW